MIKMEAILNCLSSTTVHADSIVLPVGKNKKINAYYICSYHVWKENQAKASQDSYINIFRILNLCTFYVLDDYNIIVVVEFIDSGYNVKTKCFDEHFKLLLAIVEGVLSIHLIFTTSVRFWCFFFFIIVWCAEYFPSMNRSMHIIGDFLCVPTTTHRKMEIVLSQQTLNKIATYFGRKPRKKGLRYVGIKRF